MKLFDRYFVFTIFILFSSRVLFAYDSFHTGRLRQYYNGLIENYRKTHVRPDCIAMSREIKDCVSRGANPNTIFLNGSRPILAAAEIGDKSLIEFLWLHGTNIYYLWNGLTPLQDAQRRGYSEAVIQLTCLSTGEPELHAAIRLKTHKKELKRILTTLEQDPPDDFINQLDSQGLSALHVAVVTRNKKAIRLLLSHGADPLKGRFKSLLLASGIPKWREPIKSWRKGMQPSVYEQILAFPLEHCLATLLACEQNELPKEVTIYIVQIMLTCRRDL